MEPHWISLYVELQRSPEKRVSKVRLMNKLNFHHYRDRLSKQKPDLKRCLFVLWCRSLDFISWDVLGTWTQNKIVPPLWENLTEQGPGSPLPRPAICSYNNNTVQSLLFVYLANPLYLGQPPPSPFSKCSCILWTLWKPYRLIEVRLPLHSDGLQ